MRKLPKKSCAVCGQVFQPTGSCAKYCSASCKQHVWTREVLSRRTYDWQVKKGLIKQPGVRTGHAQGQGATHHSFKADAPHRYRDFKKDSCERCGSCKFLCVHHKDHNRSNNYPANLETLCKRCHQLEHECFKNFQGAQV